MPIVLSCIHCPSHRSMYRWGCNYVPQWSSLCFFAAEELSRQRSVCAPWKLPAENHMAMRAIMDFSPPLRMPLSPLYSFLSVTPFVDQHLSRCQSMYASSNLHICTTTSPQIFSPVFCSLFGNAGRCAYTPKKTPQSEFVANQWESMLMKTILRRCFITLEDYVMKCIGSSIDFVPHIICPFTF